MFDTNVEISFEGGIFDFGDSRWIERFTEYVRRQVENITPHTVQLYASLIAKEIEQNLFLGQSYFGTKVAQLKPMTIKRKGHARVFLDTGELFQSVRDEMLTDHSARVFINDNRASIAYWLNFGTPKMVARPFFGVSSYMMQRIDRIIQTDLRN